MVRMLTRVRKKRRCSPGHRLFLIPSAVDRMEFQRTSSVAGIALRKRFDYHTVLFPPHVGEASYSYVLRSTSTVTD